MGNEEGKINGNISHSDINPSGTCADMISIASLIRLRKNIVLSYAATSVALSLFMVEKPLKRYRDFTDIVSNQISPF